MRRGVFPAQRIVWLYTRDILSGNITWNEKTLDTYITLLYKKGDTDLPASFRPIALSNSITKFIAYTARYSIEKLLNFYSSNNIHVIPPCQAGFQERQCTTDHVYTLKHLMAHFPSAATLFVDFYKAFDSVDLQVLNKLLEHLQLPPSIAQAITHTQSHTYTLPSGKGGGLGIEIRMRAQAVS